MAALRSTTVRYWSAGLRIVTILFLALSAFGPAHVTPVYADKLVCGIPGRDGPVSISGIVNTYYPGTADVDAGSTSIPIGAPSGAAAPIQAGDLLLVIQMQGADINSTNTDAYGNGVAGPPASGILGTNFSAGQYEYVIATSAAAGGTVSISSGLVNTYFNQDYSGTQGQRRFQVVRVPQYSSATIVGTVTSLPWTGRVGGVAALDVAGTLNFNGNAVNVSGQGFRGGGGVRYTGATGFAATDYRTPSTATLNASKGEGIAGTPRFVFNGTSVVDNTVEGYPNGSFARGAPGNAGGGGTDGDPAGNEDNAGGGGGANGGAGGLGGFGWRSVSDSGGFGGTAFQYTPTRLAMGGGGGAGDINNNDPVLSSGGAGGGIVMIRAGTVSGSGTINANGADGQDQPLNDSGGGGGAGGTVLVVSGDNLPGGLNVNAEGGDGGNAWPGMSNISRPGYPGWRHGPGGGGGGGVILLNSTAGTLSVAQGVHGVTTTDNDSYGSEDGLPGQLDTTVTTPDLDTSISGYECIPHPTVVKTTSTPLVTQTPTGTTGQYTIDVTIPADEGTALAFTISDVLPPGFTYAATSAVNLSGGATRPTTVNPTAGTSNPAWGTFNIPGGGRVQITFTVNIASTVPPGTYQNPATATYLDPTRTVTNGTATTEYDITDPGEDITIDAPNLPDLTVTKTNNVNGTVAQGSSFSWTITVTNSGGAPATFASGQVVMSDALPGAASYYPQGNLTVNPAGAIICTIDNTALACTANGIYSLAAGSSFSTTFQVTPTAAGNLVNTAVADPGGIMPESNENNNTASNTVTVTAATTADLSINKTNGQTIYQPGSVVTYTVTVTNLSGVAANGATVTDNKPANITTWAWACTTQSGGATGCDPAANSANNFTDTVNLPVGGTIVYTVTANVSANATGNLANTATVAVPPGLTDPDLTNNTSTDTDSPPDSADLSINKTNGQTSYQPGSIVTYTVTVTNLSGVAANGATVTDNKPANVSTWAWACTTQSGGATGCDPAADSANNFTDTVNLPVGGTIVYTVTANTLASATTNLVNTATVDVPPGLTDPDTGNNTSTDDDPIAPPNTVDLSATKDDGQTGFAGGITLTYTVKVRNNSGSTANGAVVSDPKPADIESWSWTCTMSGGATGCNGMASSANDFTDTVNLPVNGEIVYTVMATVVATPTSNTLENTVNVDPPTGYTDSDPLNNVDTDTNTLAQIADLSVLKVVDDNNVNTGDQVTFTITVHNAGPSDATGVEVTDIMPAQFTYESSTASKGTYDSVTNVWSVGDLASGETETLSIKVTATQAGNFTNRVTVAPPAGIVDPTPGNNSAETKVTVKDENPTPKPKNDPFLIPVTGFQPGVITDMSKVPHEAYLAEGNITLEIPSLGVNIAIVGVPKRNGTWNVAWLGKEAGWLEGSAFPSWNGNSVLTGHVYLASGKPGPFINLNKLKFGDKIVVHAYGHKYTFEVQTNIVVSPTDKSMMKHEEKPWLTLVTCKDYDPKSNTYLNRVLVRARLVSDDWE